MDDQAILGIMAAIAAAFAIGALHNLSSTIWVANDGQVDSVCTSVDLNTGCAVAARTPDSPRDP